jgi:NAD(P)-dependent dehydrogenase (short-subunit alcohol dehydrogenase family)
MTVARRNAIVTGAASGLGRALAVRLAADGWRIAVADIDAAGSEETVKRVEAAGGVGQFVPLDVTRLEDWESLRERLRKEWSQLDLLINNAALGCCGDVGVFPIEEWRSILNVNLYGGIYGCHTLVDWLKENPNGSHIINVASFAAIAPSPSMAAYNVAKAGMVALSETLFGELKPHGVGVTVVCPMHFRSGIMSAIRSYSKVRSQMLHERIEQSKLTAEDIAEAAIRAMRRKQLYVMPGVQARWYWWLRRLSPTGFLAGIARDAARQNEAKPNAGHGTTAP